MLPLDGRPVVGRCIDRARAVPAVDEIVLAIPRTDKDDVIERFGTRDGTAVVRGAETDVLGRLEKAAKEYDADIVLRVSCDNPLVAIDLLKALVERIRTGAAGYASSKFERTFPIGVNADAMTTSILSDAADRADDPHQREHVSQHFRSREHDYETVNVRASEVFDREFVESMKPAALRLTLDELPDYRLLYQIYDEVDFAEVLPTSAAIEYVHSAGISELNTDVTQQVW